MDLLLSARRTGPRGRVIGIDPTPAMRDCAASCARDSELSGIVEIRDGRVDALPADDASVDIVTSNGVINLAPDKEAAFREIARVMRPGGRLYLADVALDEEMSLKSRSDANLWAA